MKRLKRPLPSSLLSPRDSPPPPPQASQSQWCSMIWPVECSPGLGQWHSYMFKDSTTSIEQNILFLVFMYMMCVYLSSRIINNVHIFMHSCILCCNYNNFNTKFRLTSITKTKPCNKHRRGQGGWGDSLTVFFLPYT